MISGRAGMTATGRAVPGGTAGRRPVSAGVPSGMSRWAAGGSDAEVGEEGA